MLFIKKLLGRVAMVHKPRGSTSVQCVNEFKLKHGIGTNVPVAFSGRLDPMAEGKMVLLIGDECKKIKKYHALDKQYVVRILFGVGSDTGDLLGRVCAAKNADAFGSTDLIQVKKSINTYLKQHELGCHVRHYPAYSSKRVHGKPLFYYAHTKTLDSIEIPTHQECVMRASCTRVQHLSKEELKKYIAEYLHDVPLQTDLSIVMEDPFRKKEVTEAWKNVLVQLPTQVVVADILIDCRSGVYMRSLVQRVGTFVGTDAVAMKIHRTRIGRAFSVLGKILYF